MKTNKIYYQDCIVGMENIDDESIDMVLCDLPYGTIACKWDEIIPFEVLWKLYERIIKPQGVIALFAAQPFTTKLISSNIKLFKYCWYWKKTKAIGFQHSKNKPMRIIEEICIFSKSSVGHKSLLGNKRMSYNPQGIVPLYNKKVSKVWHGNILGARPNQVGKEYLAYTNFPNDLLSYKQPVGDNTLHPTQKPVDLCEFLIKSYTDIDAIVLDNCIGSGTTAIACLNTGRRFIGFENNKTYYKIAQSRVREHIKVIHDKGTAE